MAIAVPAWIGAAVSLANVRPIVQGVTWGWVVYMYMVARVPKNNCVDCHVDSMYSMSYH